MNAPSAFLEKFNKYELTPIYKTSLLKNRHCMFLPYLPKNITLVKTASIDTLQY